MGFEDPPREDVIQSRFLDVHACNEGITFDLIYCSCCIFLLLFPVERVHGFMFGAGNGVRDLIKGSMPGSF